MLRTMLDTSLCVRVIRRRPAFILERFDREADTLCISTVTLMELAKGAELAPRPEEKRAEVADFAARLAVLDFDQRAAEEAAAIAAALGRRGMGIGPFDTLIAGHARSRALTIVTGNLREFSRVEGLRCEDWEAAA